MQINASDDRSASSIEAKILDVVQMNSVMPDSKPKCLVRMLSGMSSSHLAVNFGNQILGFRERARRQQGNEEINFSSSFISSVTKLQNGP